jgi:ubiquinone/menaquinone biosynthesis C-methylase UbiE
MQNRFRQRSTKLEHLDTGKYTPEEFEGCIVELQRINRYLGDAGSLKRTLLREIDREKLQQFSVLDVGAGSGELLRVIARWSKSSGRNALLTGLDLNARSVQAIVDESVNFAPMIRAVQGDALQLPFPDRSFDYVISSLFTHHFDDEQIVALLRQMSRVARRGIFVIDLHRHPFAYLLYTTVGRLVLFNRLTREDGALSILRGFKPQELMRMGKQAGFINHTVQRKFPFRLVMSDCR